MVRERRAEGEDAHFGRPLGSFASVGLAGLRGRLVALFGGLGAVNLLTWAWAFGALRDRPLLLGSAVLAWGSGLRHAMDADRHAYPPPPSLGRYGRNEVSIRITKRDVGRWSLHAVEDRGCLAAEGWKVKLKRLLLLSSADYTRQRDSSLIDVAVSA